MPGIDTFSLREQDIVGFLAILPSKYRTNLHQAAVARNGDRPLCHDAELQRQAIRLQLLKPDGTMRPTFFDRICAWLNSRGELMLDIDTPEVAKPDISVGEKITQLLMNNRYGPLLIAVYCGVIRRPFRSCGDLIPELQLIGILDEEGYLTAQAVTELDQAITHLPDSRKNELLTLSEM